MSGTDLSQNLQVTTTRHKMNLPHDTFIIPRFLSTRSRNRYSRRLPFGKNIFLSNVSLFLVVCACCLSLNVPVSSSESLRHGGRNHKRHEVNNNDESDSASAAAAAAAIATNNTCSKCVPHETLKNFTLEEVKAQILLKLGFVNGAPNTSRINKATETDFPLMQNYIDLVEKNQHDYQSDDSMAGEQRMLMDESDESVKKKELIARAKPGSNKIDQFYAITPLVFTFDQKSGEKVVNATLWLYQKASVNVNYSQLVRLDVVRRTPKGGMVTVKEVEHFKITAEEKWIRFDLNDVGLLEYFNNNSDNTALTVSLIIHVSPARVVPHGPLIPLITQLGRCDTDTSAKNNPQECHYDPCLQLVTAAEPKSKRLKRSSPPTDCSGGEQVDTCCRYNMVVNFTEFQWDFIIAPKTYNAYFCAGECTYLSMQKDTHTHIVMLANTLKDRKIGPCCGPRALGSIAMLYFNDNGNVVFVVLPRMVVQRCGCQ